MSLNDWNHDGKKDGFDNFIEYQIYKDTSENITDTFNSHTGRDDSHKQVMSTIGALLCIFSGLFWQALLFTMLKVDVEVIPALLIIVLWIVFSTITMRIVYSIRNK